MGRRVVRNKSWGLEGTVTVKSAHFSRLMIALWFPVMSQRVQEMCCNITAKEPAKSVRWARYQLSMAGRITDVENNRFLLC